MNADRAFQVILGPHVSEKATMAADSGNQVVFKVLGNATKKEIHQAVEKLFNVTVVRVNTVNIKGKVKRTARGIGKRKDLRKAYVTLAEGHDIDFMDVE